MAIITPVLLIVDDEMALLESISLRARAEGFEPVTARSVPEAIDFLNNIATIDAVWIDHFLPDQAGLELVKYMRQQPKWQQTPIYLVTNAVEPEIVNEYMKLGIQGYYPKVLVKMNEVMEKIRAQLGTAA